MDLQSKYEEYYRPLVKQYAEKLKSAYPLEAYEHIPQLFLPEWGTHYERSLVKMAFIGLETYGWGDLCSFLNQIKNQSWGDVFDVSEFQNLDYVNWNPGHRYSFLGL